MTVTARPCIDDARTAFSELTGERPIAVSALPKGWGHLAWFVQAASGSYLLKSAVRRSGVADLYREVAAQQIAAVGGLCTPAVVAVSAEGNALGRPCYLQTWIDGHDAETTLPGLSGEAPLMLARRFGQAVAILHAITGPRFAEDAAATRSYPTWKKVCTGRLQRMAAANRDAALLPAAVLEAVAADLETRIASLAEGIRPALTHRDLHLPNLIDRGPQLPVALVDFESAAFYDPVWDFVKLHMWVFDIHPHLRRPFLAGYTAETPLPADFAERLVVYQGIEYLAGFPYFGRTWPDAAMLESFRRLLGRWMDAAGLRGARP